MLGALGVFGAFGEILGCGSGGPSYGLGRASSGTASGLS